MLNGLAMNTGEPLNFQKECDNKPIDGKLLQDIIQRQSDCSVVAKKPLNGGGAKGTTRMSWVARETIAAHRGGEQLSTKLVTLTLMAKRNPKLKFTSITGTLIDERFLKECFWELKRNKAPGIDGVTVEEYGKNLAENLQGLAKRLKVWNYKPQPVRRTYIPKGKDEKRPLGIPAVEDKIVQMGIKKILEAIYEVDFLDVSYGFRPKRNCHEALKVLDKAIMTEPINSVVDMDAKKYFDTIDHNWLMRFLKERITDRNLLRLIGRFLNTGVMEKGEYTEVDKGTPQGGLISPILANIYLHYVLDLWFEKKMKKEIKGYARLIRYADDFVVLLQSHKEAKRFGEILKERFNKFGLSISDEKSRIIEFGENVWKKSVKEKKAVETFDFLGFRHFCEATRAGRFKLGRKTSPKKYGQKTMAINLWLKSVRNKVKLGEWWKIFRMKLSGHYRYYGVSGNYVSLDKFYWQTRELALKWINRRSQKMSFTYLQYEKFLEYHPLPRPVIHHSLYTLSH
jgi:RNA-directed DNA polymerase